MYSGDLAEAIWFTLENFEELPNSLNVGLGRDYSVLEFYQIAAKVMKYDGNFIFNKNKPQGMKRKIVDSQKINKLGWRAKTDLETGIKKAYEFYLDDILKKTSQ